MKNIVLIGFMGTGKSAVGKRLARALHFRFVDTDGLIEQKTGKTISDIFEQEGEGAFRALEEEVIREVTQQEQQVISTGGGAVLNRNNIDRLGQNGILVWLRASPETILRRAQRRPEKRPLLKVSDPQREIERLLQERIPYYQQAVFSVETSNISVDEAADQVKKGILEIEGRKGCS